MALKKHVNGRDIEMTPEEEAATLAAWAANDAKPPPPPPRNLVAEIDDLKTRLEAVERRR